MAAEANEETGETESGRQRTPLTMLAPPAVLVALALAAGIAGMVPRFGAAVLAAAVRFQDQAAYTATVLDGAHPAALLPAGVAEVTISSVVVAVCSVLGAVLLALVALYWRRLPLLRRGYEPGAAGASLTAAIRRFQSGVINDYITWLVAGLACLGGVLALIVR